MIYKYTFTAYDGKGEAVGNFSIQFETDNPNRTYPDWNTIRKAMWEKYPEAINYINKLAKILHI